MGGAAPLLRLRFTVEISSFYDYYSDEEEDLDGGEGGGACSAIETLEL